MSIRLSQEQFEALVRRAVEELPEEFARRMENVSVEVLDRPTPDWLRSVGMRRSPRGLLGLYHGVPLDRKSVSAPWDWPERIFIFRENIERICETPEQVVDQVRRTVLHEVGHHFGMDEQDLRRLGY